MLIATTIFQLACVWLLAWAMGLAAVKCFLPADIEREHGTFLAPMTGMLMLCLVSFVLSAALDMAVANAVWSAMGFLLLAAAATQLRPAWRLRPSGLPGAARRSFVVAAPMLVLVLWPLLWFGAGGYLGTVNPDFFHGVIDLRYLLDGHSITTFAPTAGDGFHPAEGAAGFGSASARFGSELFAAAIHLVLRTDIRAALALTVGFSLLCLPLTVHAMCRIVMGFTPRAANLAGGLMGLSAPVAMSYLYYYLGQNAGLPAMPLLAVAAYLMVTRPSWGTAANCAMLANALFIVYFAMVPFALAPAGALAAYLLAIRRLRLRDALLMAATFAAVTAVVVLANFVATLESLRMWMGVIGQSLQGQYFLDFLTESFFSYFLGIFNYQSSPWAVDLMGQVGARLAGTVVALACLLALGAFVLRWAREERDSTRRVFVLSALLIYAAVWAEYSFVKQYGYAVFKLSSWLQFILVPFMAYGIDRLATQRPLRAQGTRARVVWGAGVVAMAAWLALNVTAAERYGYNGLGDNRRNGYIVNNFGMSGNRDFFELKDVLSRFVKPEESIGLVFTDSIRNWWVSYYAWGIRQSMLSHSLMPGDDENLPDIRTNVVIDYYGNVEHLQTDYFHDGVSDQYFLTWNSGDLNPDIIVEDFRTAPIWQNPSLRLFRSSDVHDLLFTGRGFYRLEYFEPITTYFFPRVMRWSAEGGEFYLLKPRHPGEAYRLSFDAIVGYEYPNDTRTLELYLDGRKFDEITITSSARVVSAPFRPGPGANRLVVRIKERNKPLPRPLALWNKEIPADYRRMNVAFSNARLMTPDDAQPSAAQVGSPLTLLPLISAAYTFNGFQLDGWIGDKAEVTLPRPPAANALEISGMVPDSLGFTFPLTLNLQVDRRSIPRQIAAAGPFTVSVPLSGDAPHTSIAIEPTQSKEMGNEVGIRHKVIRRSLRIDSLTFR